MSCRRCTVPVSPFLGPDDRVCGFGEDGLFRSENKGCATLHFLRSAGFLCTSSRTSDGYERLAAVPVPDGQFVILGWHGDLARVHTAFLLAMRAGAQMEGRLTLAIAEQVIAATEARLR